MTSEGAGRRRALGALGALGLGMGLGLGWGALVGTRAAAEPLARYAWSARPLLLFAPAEDDPELARQTAALAARREALADREMPVIEVVGAAVRVDGRPADISADALRAAYEAPAARFELVLVGKDGGVKLRRAEATDPEAVFARVDAMPMRRREIEERDGE